MLLVIDPNSSQEIFTFLFQSTCYTCAGHFHCLYWVFLKAITRPTSQIIAPDGSRCYWFALKWSQGPQQSWAEQHKENSKILQTINCDFCMRLQSTAHIISQHPWGDSTLWLHYTATVSTHSASHLHSIKHVEAVSLLQINSLVLFPRLPASKSDSCEIR